MGNSGRRPGSSSRRRGGGPLVRFGAVWEPFEYFVSPQVSIKTSPPPPTPSPRTAKMKKLASSPRNTSAAEMEGELSSFLHLCFTQGKNQHRVPGRGVWPRPCAGCELPSQHPHTPHPPQLPRQLLALDGAFRENKGRNATTWS